MSKEYQQHAEINRQSTVVNFFFALAFYETVINNRQLEMYHTIVNKVSV